MNIRKKRTVSDWAVMLLLAGSFFVALITFGNYLSKVAAGTAVPDDVVRAVLYGIFGPYILTTLALYIIKTQFEKVRSSFEETNDNLVDRFSQEIIRPLKIDLINAIKPTAHYNVIVNHPRKETLEVFIPGILDDFENKLAMMSMGHIYEYDPAKYHKFATSMFELAKEKIIATSIVDPTGFWDHPMALSYLNNNKKIAAKSNFKFIRYFFVNDDDTTGNKEQSLSAIANNLVIGVEVFIIKDDEKLDGDYRIDACLIDDFLAVISKVDKKNNIFGVDAYIDDSDRVPWIRDWTDFLENNRVKVTEYYSTTDAEIRGQATIKL